MVWWMPSPLGPAPSDRPPAMKVDSIRQDLSLRDRQPEWMDSPELDREHHQRALRALARINFLSFSARRVWARLRKMATASGAPLRMLDVACGGGDVAIALKRRAEREGMDLQVHACDLSADALEFARERAGIRGAKVDFFRLDATNEPLPGGFDLVCSSLFLHHLSREEGVTLLREMAGAGRSVLIQDLLRSQLGYFMAMVTVRTITRSPVVRVDGPRSVRAAYSLPEVRSLSDEAGLEGVRVEKCWPERFALEWEKS